MVNPESNKFSYGHPGVLQLLRIVLSWRVKVGTVGRPLYQYRWSGGRQILGDAQGVPGVEGAMDEHHVGYGGLQAAVLRVGQLNPSL